MNKAKPIASALISSMIAGTLIGIATMNILTIKMPDGVCETFAILIVGFLLQFAAVLKVKRLELLLMLTCFTITLSTTYSAHVADKSYQITIYTIGMLVALIACDALIKRFTKLY
jgi:cellobiose-specific phosphotransferase system component IIC